MEWAAESDAGRIRTNNEDAWGAFPDAGLWCVADGMGGAAGGEVASHAVVAALGEAVGRWPADASPCLADRVELVRRAADGASDWIFGWAAKNDAPGAGTTLVVLLLDPAAPAAPMALHAGDSRLYRLRGRRLVRITRDHSAAEAVGARDESRLAPGLRNVILRAVGVRTSVELESTPFSLAGADRLLLCSDGLYRMVPERSIARLMRTAATPAAAAAALVAAANESGGADNVTALVLFAPSRLPPPVPVDGPLSAAAFRRLSEPEGTADGTPDTERTETTDAGPGNGTEGGEP